MALSMKIHYVLFVLFCSCTLSRCWRVHVAPAPNMVSHKSLQRRSHDWPVSGWRRSLQPIASLSGLGLRPNLQQAASAQGWHMPTDIQETAIPVIIDKLNVWAEAPTGSGKTAAFVLSLLHRLVTDIPSCPRDGPYIRILVLAPTRELVEQTTKAFRACSERTKTVALYGGVSTDYQLRDYTGADVLVATPGRLVDELKSERVSLKYVSVLLLDEADRLLAPGFENEIQAILEKLPPPEKRQTLLFSATFPYRSRPKAKQLFGDGAFFRITSGPDGCTVSAAGHGDEDERPPKPSKSERYNSAPPPSSISQRAIRVDLRERTSLLRHLLQEEDWARVLVFVGSRKTAERVTRKLRNKGVDAEALHGNMSQDVRSSRIEALRRNRLNVLVATDLASRGIDVQGLEAIVNYDLPRSTSDYTHRIGRTGRAGNNGSAVSFVASTGPGNEDYFRLIEKRHGNMRVPRETVEGFEPKAVDYHMAEVRTDLAALDDGDHPLQPLQRSPVEGVQHSKYGLAHDRMHGGVKGRKLSKKDKLRLAAMNNLNAARKKESAIEK